MNRTRLLSQRLPSQQRGTRPEAGARSRWLLLLILGLLLLPAACGDDDTGEDGGIVISDVWSRPVLTAEMDMSQDEQASAEDDTDQSEHDMTDSGATGVVYVTFENQSGEDERLVGASVDFAEAVELHTTEMENGVMQMRQVQGIDLPAGETVALEPGGYHIMLVGLEHNLEAGDEFDVTFEFERMGTLTITSSVREEAP